MNIWPRAACRILVGLGCAAGATVLPALCFSVASARTWLVLEDGSGDAPTIQAAVDSTAPGDTVRIGAGTFAEHVVIPSTPDLVLSGAFGAEDTSIDPPGVGYAFLGTGVDVLIQDLRLLAGASDGYGFGGGAISLQGDAQVRHCAVEGGIGVEGDLDLSDCTVRNVIMLSRELVSCSVWFRGTSLRVERCDFEGGPGSPVLISCDYAPAPALAGLVRDNVFRSNGSPWDPFGGVVGYILPEPLSRLDLIVEDNLFVGNATAAVSEVHPPVISSPKGARRGCSVAVLGNTVVGALGCGLDGTELPAGVLIERNIFAYGECGVRLGENWETQVMTCNVAWENGVDWDGFPDPTGQDGNRTESPRFCDPDHGVYTVAANSPCGPNNNVCGQAIGAFGVGCDPVSVESASWARIKSFYRSGSVR